MSWELYFFHLLDDWDWNTTITGDFLRKFTSRHWPWKCNMISEKAKDNVTEGTHLRNRVKDQICELVLLMFKKCNAIIQ